MKKLLLALCLAGLGVACRASGASMADTSDPKAGECADKAECCQSKAECQAETECEGEQVCPVTGKSMN